MSTGNGWPLAKLSDVAVLLKRPVKPFAAPDEEFAHYSIPAFDSGARPAHDSGSKIKSTKTLIENGVVLFSKLNPRISRVWHINDTETRRRVCSTEFLPLRPEEFITLLPYAQCMGFNAGKVLYISYRETCHNLRRRNLPIVHFNKKTLPTL